MRLEIDTRFAAGVFKGKQVPLEYAESALAAVMLVVSKFKENGKILKQVSALCIEFEGDDLMANMKAKVVVLVPNRQELTVETSRIMECSARIRSDTALPTAFFFEKILDAMALASGFRLKSPAAA